jgi:molecular chaperone Hsp33
MDMVEADGQIHVTCEYCSKTYAVTPEALEAAPAS